MSLPPPPIVVQPTTRRLPKWLPLPVVIAAPFSAILVFLFVTSDPIKSSFSLIAFVIVGAALLWLDTVEPKPAWSRVSMMLWGGTVAIVAAMGLEYAIHIVISNNIASGAVAGVVEEAAKFTGLLWLIRRFKLVTVVDGAIYAAWIALGFAVVEDIGYLAATKSLNSFVFTVVLRLILTPFAHPLFTAFTGMGLVLSRRKKNAGYLIGGLLIAMLLHAAWDMSIFTSMATHNLNWIILAGVFFFILFVVVAILFILARRQEKNRLTVALPAVCSWLGFPPALVTLFSNPSVSWAYRKSLHGQPRDDFDELCLSLVEIAHCPPSSPELATLAPAAVALERKLESSLYDVQAQQAAFAAVLAQRRRFHQSQYVPAQAYAQMMPASAAPMPPPPPPLSSPIAPAPQQPLPAPTGQQIPAPGAPLPPPTPDQRLY